LPIIRFPFDLASLPNNGIYFFYEDSEHWSHGGKRPRIVRVGTHKDGNFRSRIAEHFVLDERKMNFDTTTLAPHERSIFRKHIGRALLNRSNDPYLKVWNIDFTSKASRERDAHLRDIGKEKTVECEITALLRKYFSFRYIVVAQESVRMGVSGIERKLIGTVAQCSECSPSRVWLGNQSPQPQIRETGLWLIHHLKTPTLSPAEMNLLAKAIGDTRTWIKNERRLP